MHARLLQQANIAIGPTIDTTIGGKPWSYDNGNWEYRAWKTNRDPPEVPISNTSLEVRGGLTLGFPIGGAVHRLLDHLIVVRLEFNLAYMGI
jgi:hypothetical protein